MVSVNGRQIKIYDNNRLTVMDAAIQIGFPKDNIFPRRGKELIYYVNDMLKKMDNTPVVYEQEYFPEEHIGEKLPYTVSYDEKEQMYVSSDDFSYSLLRQ